MKKSLIALAALAAVSAASAQSTVTIGGIIDSGYVATNNPGTVVDTKGLAANGTATTALNISGSEDLGGGLSGIFRIQLTPDFINGNGVGGSGATNVGTGQEAFLGLSSKTLGTLKLGRVNTNALDAWGVGSVFGTAIGSGYGSNGNIFTRYSVSAANTTNASQSAPTRFNGAIRYESPVFSGFSGSALIVPKANSADAQSVSDLGLRYAAGPLTVMVATQSVKQTGAPTAWFTGNSGTATTPVNPLTAGTSNKLNVLAANYTIGAATVYASTWSEKQNTATRVDVTGRMIGAKYTLGATTLMASYAVSNDKIGTAGGVDKKIMGIGADYALSKRTALYARMDSRDANTNSSVTDAANGTVKRTAVGVRHSF